ncbi:MAG: polymorphic toxin-type HINT domain-containing protein [Sporichthyaceae bacterium]
MADGTTKAISEIEIGDEVLAEDPETGERGPRKVTALWVHDDDMVDLDVDGHALTTREDHPFWNATDGQWQEAQDLDAGDTLLTADGRLVPVNGLRVDAETTDKAYNLTVDGIHTYYVVTGDANAVGKPATGPVVLVHNTCDFSLFSGTGGIHGTLNEDGVVDFAIERGNSAIPGHQMFNEMMDHFGDRVTAVRGN